MTLSLLDRVRMIRAKIQNRATNYSNPPRSDLVEAVKVLDDVEKELKERKENA